MPYYLILRLDGPMQAWGTHTFEDLRPSNFFPTRSGLLGLIAACLGIDRRDRQRLRELSESLVFTVRDDRAVLRPGIEQPFKKTPIKSVDFHTVLKARKVDGTENPNPIVSSREYLFDAAFTVAVRTKPEAFIQLDEVAQALRRPYFTPTLGRRSCPIARPLLEAVIEAENVKSALDNFLPVGGLLFSEGDLVSSQPIRIRDVPMHSRHRRFGTRLAYVHKEPPCS